MAELAFKVKADYEEVMKMRMQLQRLYEEMMKVDVSSVDGQRKMQALAAEYARVNGNMSKLVADASEYAIKLKQTADNATRLEDAFKFGRTFEGSRKAIKDFLKNLQSDLQQVKQQIKDAETGIAADNNLKKELDGQLRDAEMSMKQIQETITKYNFSENEAIGGVLNPLDKSIAEKEKELENLKRELDEFSSMGDYQGIAQAAIAAREGIESLRNDDSPEAASRRLTLWDIYSKGVNGLSVNTGNEELTMNKLQEIASGNLESIVSHVEELQSAISHTEEELSALKTTWNEVNADLDGAAGYDTTLAEMRQQASDAEKKVSDLKQQLSDLENGVAGSGKTEQELDNLKNKSGELEAKIRGVQARLKDDSLSKQNSFTGLTQGLQGLMGAYTAASGVLAQFGVEEEDLQKVQTKLQASMSILMGMQHLFNALQSESAFRVQVVDKAMLSLAKTYQKVAASTALAKLGIAGVAMAAIAGVAALVLSLSKFAKSEKETSDRIKKTSQAASEQIVSFMQLQTQWKAANGDLKKQNDLLNSSKMGQFASQIKDVNSAQDAFIKNSAKYINALIAQAEAEIYLEEAKEKARKGIKAKMEADEYKEKFDNASNGLMRTYYHNQMLKKREEANKILGGPNSEVGKLLLQAASLGTKSKQTLGDPDADEARARASQVAKLQRDQLLATKRQIEDAEMETRQLRINLMKDSAARELAQLNLDYEKEKRARERQKEDRIRQLQEQQKNIWQKANPNRKDYEFASSIKDLPEAERKQYEEQARLSEQQFEKSKKELLDTYGDIATRRKNIADSWAETIGPITDKQIRRILEIERDIELANFDYENSVNGTRQEKLDTFQGKIIADSKKIKDPYQRQVFLAQGGVQMAEMRYGSWRDYGSYDKAVEAANKVYEAKKDQYTLEEDNLALMKLEIEYAQQMWDIELKYNKDLEKVFGNVSKYTSAQLANAKSLALATLKAGKINGKELTIEQIKDLQNAINSIEDAEFAKQFQVGNDSLADLIKNMQYLKMLENQWVDAVADGNDEEERRLKDLIDQYNEMTDKDKIATGVSLLAKGLGTAAGYMKQIASLSSDSDLKDVAEGFEQIGNSLSTGLQVYQQSGSWQAGVVAGVADLFKSGLDTFFENYDRRQALYDRTVAAMFKIRELNFSNNLTDGFDSIFGNDASSKIRNAAQSLETYNEKLEKAEKQIRQMYDDATITRLEDYQFKVYENKGFLGIGGSEARYSLRELSERLGAELYDKYGNLNAATLQTILDTYTDISGSERKWIEQAIADSKEYEDAINVLKENLSSIFGDMSSKLTDMTIKGLRSGAEIGSYEMKQILGSAVVDLQKQMVNGIYARYLQQYEDDAFEILKNGGNEEDLVSLYASMIDNLSDTVATATAAAQHFDDVAREHGFEMDEIENAESSTGAYQNISETTGSAIEGRLAALQIASSERVQLAYESVNIERDTRNVMQDSYLALVAIRNNTGDNLQTVMDIKEIVTNIEIKTRNL